MESLDIPSQNPEEYPGKLVSINGCSYILSFPFYDFR